MWLQTHTASSESLSLRKSLRSGACAPARRHVMIHTHARSHPRSHTRCKLETVTAEKKSKHNLVSIITVFLTSNISTLVVVSMNYVLYTILKCFYLRDTDLAWHPLCNSSKRLRLLCAVIGKLGRQRCRCDNQVLRNADTVMQPPSHHFPQLNLELTALYSISTGCQPPSTAESVSVAF